jgi:hypothetical protein
LFFGVLQIAIANIEPDGITEDELCCVLRRNVLCCFAQHNGKLNLEISSMLRERDFDRAAMRQK